MLLAADRTINDEGANPANRRFAARRLVEFYEQQGKPELADPYRGHAAPIDLGLPVANDHN